MQTELTLTSCLFGQCLFPGIFLLLIPFAIMMSLQQIKRYNEMLATLATELGCRIEQPNQWSSAQIRGQYRGREIHIYTVTEGSGKHRHTHTIVSAQHKGKIDAPIDLTPENMGTRIVEALGGQDIKTGNQTFDDKYRIQSKWPGAAQAINLEIQQKLQQQPLTATINQQTVYTKTPTQITDKQALKQLIDQITDLAEATDTTN